MANYASPGTRIDLADPDDFPGAEVLHKMHTQKVLTGLHHAMAVPAIVRKVVWAEQQGYDAVVQSNQFDPGVEAARLTVHIPVVGLLRTAVHTASLLTDRVGITVPTDGHVTLVRHLLRSYGLENHVVDIRPINIFSANLAAQKEEIFTRTVDLMRGMVRECSAGVIVPLGGAFVPMVISAADLGREVGVPVTDNAAIGIRFAEMCVHTGLTHSPVTYPTPKLTLEDFSQPWFSHPTKA
jgi:allantoin racemase